MTEQISSQRVAGPKDITEIPSTLGYISFGSLLMPTIEGVTVRGEVSDSTGQVVSVSFEHDGSSLQVSAFAASKSEEMWPDVSTQIKASIETSGGSVVEGNGGFGRQLDVRVATPDGQKEMRFIGVDGPRWFLRGVISGAALTNQTAAQNMEDIFRSLVVDRGNVPLPPREALPLKLPDGTFAPPKFDI
ncbi:MAG: hypothetical protein RL140_340 [Actinomycetota bacterium]|jgi:hypothetical protein